jgi:predicted glycoside hydrolase/deacetylase ChbG (UPF0249 family)
MPAQQISSNRHPHQNHRERQVVTLDTPLQQQSVARLIDGEAQGGNQDETPRRGQEGSVQVPERQAMVPGEGDPERHQPPQHVRTEGLPLPLTHQKHDDAPVHGSRATTNSDEPQNPLRPSDGGAQRTREMDEFFYHDAPEHSRPRSLCLCVDDFGLHEGVNIAALKLAEMERVHAIGCMVGAPAWKSWHSSAQRMDAGAVDLGLHLDLTEYPLLSPMRQTVARWIVDSYLGRLDRTRVRAEIRAQLDAFESAMGHVHQFPGVRDELLDELTGRYGSFKPWIRSTRAASPMGPNLHGGWRGLAKSRVIAHLGASGMALLASRGHYLQNRHLLGAYDFQTSADRYRAMLLASLKMGEEGDLLMCHPSARIQLADPIHAARKMEFEVLGSSAFAQWLTDAGIELRAMSSILGH